MTATTTQTTSNSTLTRCECCPAVLKPGEAQVSRRALNGRVLCWRCRRREFPTFTVPHQLPAGFTAEARWSGYGRPEVTLTRTIDGTNWIGGGLSVEQALYNARVQAREAGAL